MAGATRSRRSAGLRDMAISLAVLLGGVVLFVVLQPRSHGQAVRSVDFGPQVDIARNQAPYPIVAPMVLPPGWQANYARVSVDGEVGLHLGLVRDATRFAQLDESNRPDAAFLAAAHVPARVAGSVIAGGRTYEVRRAEDGHVALARRLAGGALVSLSDGGGESAASYDELVALAGSLQDEPRG